MLRRLVIVAGLVFSSAAACSAWHSAPQPEGGTPQGTTGGGQVAGAEASWGVPVPAGPFSYGASEQNFQMVVSTLRIGFPGIKEEIHQMLSMPPRTVDLPAFRIGEFEVTNEQYAEFLKATGYVPEKKTGYLSHWSGGTYPDWAASFPVIWVSEEDAAAYCKWQGGRLPTDEEWEKAARGTEALWFPWGNRDARRETTNIGTDKLEPVGNRPEDRSPYGVYDMGGNVSELTSTPVRFQGRELYSVRGGSYQAGIQYAFAFHRYIGMAPGERAETIGFRCAASAP